jgi:hypothetical protein
LQGVSGRAALAGGRPLRAVRKPRRLSRREQAFSLVMLEVRLTFEASVREAVSTKVSLLCSADAVAHRRLKHRFPHKIVDHSIGQHVE